ncbi:YDG/SRA domain-containing protein [Agromyces sp. MMS24-K17]|uniref:YDG/SRA domain-containing protein n=1 Tax=Agromyces sp. MMS24-K17 TaxID=3372850 RepID=UPI003754782C
MARFFGTPAGVHPGQFFIDRQELRDAFVHRPPQAGISGTAAEGADSIVVSGGYVDDVDSGTYLLYTGQGGRDQNTGRQIADQSPHTPGNAGLITSMVRGLPVRVIRGRHPGSPFAPPRGYRYSGLYSVTSWQMKEGRDGFQVVMFRLDAIEQQAVIEPAPRIEFDPAFREATVSRRIRDTAMSRAIKELYQYSCQVCGTRIDAFEGRLYAEGAHVRPIGRPHLGSDDRSNLLCLCPNHHAQLDIGGMYISNDMVAIDANTHQALELLRWKRDHRVEVANVEYHRSLWMVEK